MDNNIDKEKEKKEQTLSKLLGMNFTEDGNWSANDIGQTPFYKKSNRKERRATKAILRKSKKGK